MNDIHGSRDDLRTDCGLTLRRSEALLDAEGRPVRRLALSITAHDDWVTCPACRAALGLPEHGVGPDLSLPSPALACVCGPASPCRAMAGT